MILSNCRYLTGVMILTPCFLERLERVFAPSRKRNIDFPDKHAKLSQKSIEGDPSLRSG